MFPKMENLMADLKCLENPTCDSSSERRSPKSQFIIKNRRKKCIVSILKYVGYDLSRAVSLVADVTYSDILSGLHRWCLLCIMSLRMVIYWFYCA